MKRNNMKENIEISNLGIKQQISSISRLVFLVDSNLKTSKLL